MPLAHVGLEPFDGARQVLWQHGQQANGAAEGVAHGSELLERTAAAEELDPLAALEPLERACRDDADRACVRDVRAAARGQIEAVDVDKAQRALANRFLPQRERRGVLGAGVANRHGPILPDNAVGLRFGGGDLITRQLAGEIDRGRARAEVKAHGAHAEQPVRRSGQHVLATVLLHVIEAPRPVDHPAGRLAHLGREFGRLMLVEHVHHRTVVFVEDVHHTACVERAEVCRDGGALVRS